MGMVKVWYRIWMGLEPELGDGARAGIGLRVGLELELV